MNVEEMKELLKSAESTSFSAHVRLKMKIREDISEDSLIEHIKHPESLAYCQYQGKEYGCDKYELIFDKSNKYDLRIIVAIKETSLTVITAHIQNKKKRKRLEKWLKK